MSIVIIAGYRQIAPLWKTGHPARGRGSIKGAGEAICGRIDVNRRAMILHQRHDVSKPEGRGNDIRTSRRRSSLVTGVGNGARRIASRCSDRCITCGIIITGCAFVERRGGGAFCAL